MKTRFPPHSVSRAATQAPANLKIGSTEVRETLKVARRTIYLGSPRPAAKTNLGIRSTSRKSVEISNFFRINGFPVFAHTDITLEPVYDKKGSTSHIYKLGRRRVSIWAFGSGLRRPNSPRIRDFHENEISTPRRITSGDISSSKSPEWLDGIS